MVPQGGIDIDMWGVWRLLLVDTKVMEVSRLVYVRRHDVDE